MTIRSRVSVIVPCYQAAATLEESVQGVMNQSYPDWELLLMVDGMGDNTANLAMALAEKDSRISVVVSKKNRGVIRSRNLGMRLAKGQWIAFCDSDDVWLPNKLTMQLAAAQKAGANLICSSFEFVDSEGAVVRRVDTSSRIDLATLLTTNPIPMSTSLFALDGRHYFPPLSSQYIHEDYAFWITLFSQHNINAVNIPVVTTQIRTAPGSRSSNKWLAAKSHGYILKQYGKITGWRWCKCMVRYCVNALKKRM